MKEPDKQVIDDYEHRVNKLIDKYANLDGSPNMEAYGFSKTDLDSYLFDKQAILDMGGSTVTKMKIAGFVIVLPVIILSAFPDKSFPFGQWTICVAIAFGLLLYLFIRSLIKMIISVRVHKNANKDIDKYIRDLQFFANSRK